MRRSKTNSISICKAFFLVVVVCIFSSAAFGQAWDGNGVEGDPYLIYTPADMQAIGADPNYWDKHFKLMANINLGGYTGTSYNIIGVWGGVPFSGVFDGSGHTISNFTYSFIGKSNIGLFGYVDEGGEIKDLGVINPNVECSGVWDDCIGSLVGVFLAGRISGCYVEGGSVSGYDYVGGLVGVTEEGAMVSWCYSTASVSGVWPVGGLVGFNGWGTITNCRSTGTVSGHRISVGGLVGENGGPIANCYSSGSVSGVDEVGGLVGKNYGLVARISNCYSTASVTGSNKVGGLVGVNSASGGVTGIIRSCYSVGSVVGDSNVGGLVGLNDNGTVFASFWDKQSSGRSNMCGSGSGSGCDDGNGKTTAEMQDVNTFLGAGWDYVGEYENGPSDDWAEAPGGGYMICWWQLLPLPPLPTFSGGAGTDSEPYLISNGIDLNRIGHNGRLMSAHFELTNHIDLMGMELFIIASLGYPFNGVFDGNGHTISNLTVDCNGTDYIGLFTYVMGEDAEIKDLGLIDPNVDARTGDNVGSLVGWLTDGTITVCHVDGGSVSGGESAGGLAGYNNGGAIRNCCAASVSVSGDKYVGGLVGMNYGTITECDSSGSVSGTISVGGLVGSGGDVSNCYSTCSVSGDWGVGGLVGAGGGIFKCYSTGSVVGTGSFVGGLVGLGGATNCYSKCTVSGENIVGGLVGSGGATNCYSKCTVSGENIVGGLVGENSYGGRISNCYARGSISGIQYIGGLVGFNYGDVADCYSRVEVTGVLDVGGLVGENGYYSNPYITYWGTIANCYAAGPITGAAYVGGLVGNNDGGVAGSLWDVDTSGPSNMCGRQGGHGSGCNDASGKTTAEMQDPNTFLLAGWDFVGEVINGPNDFWDICGGTNYPKLVWQIPVLGDFGCPDGVDMSDLGVLCEQWLFEKLLVDVAPVGGDGLIDFLDWAAFAAAWRSEPGSPNWDQRCDVAPESGDEIVDIKDVAIFTKQWLKTGSYYLRADVAPDGGDGVVNMLDYCVLAENWLAGFSN